MHNPLNSLVHCSLYSTPYDKDSDLNPQTHGIDPMLLFSPPSPARHYTNIVSMSLLAAAAAKRLLVCCDGLWMSHNMHQVIFNMNK